MGTQLIDEAYQRLLGKGPEFGGDEEGDNGLTNHGPMAVEVMIRRGLDIDVGRWLDHYLERLTDLPAAAHPITEGTWREALGDGRRIGDWTAYFERRVTEQPWQEVLAGWWPRLLPGIAAGSTHGVIRVGHAVRTLLGGDTGSLVTAELARALAFWAARSRVLPGTTAPAGDLPAAAALHAVPRLAEQRGLVAHRLGRLGDLHGWTSALAALRPPADPAEVPGRLADLSHAALLGYLAHGHASPVLLVHTATAPNAVRHILPALPRDQWQAGFTAAWTAAAAITAAYAPAEAAPTAPARTYTAADVLDRAAGHGDEHVIKLADTAVDIAGHTGRPEVLAAAAHAATLISRP